MKQLKNIIPLSLLLFLYFTLSSSMILPSSSEGLVNIENILPAKSNKKTKNSKNKSAKFWKKNDKVNQKNANSETVLISIIALVVVVTIGVLALVLKGTSLSLLFWILGGIGLLLLIIWGIIVLINK